MSSEISKYNLERDKNVLGKEWLSIYGNWFSDEENIKQFIKAVKPILPDKELDILYVASASGLLGEKLVSDLGRGRLTLVDISQKHLDENKNPKTEKICTDLLDMNIGKRFDVIMMRSSLDYFPSRTLQIKVLKILKDHLRDGGVFINQPAYVSDIKQRDIISNVYNAIDKIGNRFFQSSDIVSIYSGAGFGTPEKVGEGKIMNLTEKDHIKRYRLTDDDVKRIQEILGGNFSSIRITEKGYTLKFEFPLFIAK